MKLVIGGSTGFVGVELVRQALSYPAITSVVALSRRETPIPPEAGPDSTKLRPLVCDNFESYSDRIKEELEDADACIWCGLPFVHPRLFFARYELPIVVPRFHVPGSRMTIEESINMILIWRANLTQDHRRDTIEAQDYSLRGDMQDFPRLCHHSHPDPRKPATRPRPTAPLHLHERPFCPT